MISKPSKDDQFSEADVERRRDAITKAMIATPPHKHEPMNGKKRNARKRKAKRKS